MANEPEAEDGALTADPVFDGLLRAIAGAPVSTPDPSSGRALPLEPGRSVGPFRLLEVIGKGGSGVVYRAEDQRLGREVAIKLAWETPSGPAPSERLLQEARTAAHFLDPRIASVYEVGEAEGRAFIAMELVRGTSLRAWLAQHSPRQAAEALALSLEIARALESIHAQGWVHRDVKPDNIAVQPDGQIKLLDFGIARPSAPVASTEAIAGTPDYMAPEQREGRGGDARADVFAFGVLLQQLWCGRVARAPLELPGWGARDRGVARLIAACLHPDPARRPASGAALVQALEALGSSQRRRRLSQGFGAALSLGLLALLAVLRPWEPPAPPPLARSIRLTGNQLIRPISAAAVSWSGAYFAYVDDDGLVVGPVAAPERTRRVALEAPASYVEAIPGSADWMALTSTGSGPTITTVWRLAEDGSGARRVTTGPLTVASINPVDGRLAVVQAHSLEVRGPDGPALWRHDTLASTWLGSATWSPDGRWLAVTYSDLKASAGQPCLEVWDGTGPEVRYSLCSARLRQTYAPVVSTWGPGGELIYAYSDQPGAGRGAAVWSQRLDGSGAARGAAVPLLRLEQQFLASLSLSGEGALLSLRQETTLRPLVAALLPDGTLGPPQRLGRSEFDGRLSAWSEPDTLWGMSFREWVPRAARLGRTEEAPPGPELPGWAQSWPTPVAGEGGLLFWFAERPEGEAAPIWKLSLLREGKVWPVATPSKAEQPLSVGAAPPSMVQTRCAVGAPICLLGSPEAGGYGIYRLSLSGGTPERLWLIPDFDPVRGAWQILPDGRGLVVGDPSGALITYGLDGRVLDRVALTELQWIRSIGVDPTSAAIYASGHGPSLENFRIVRVAAGRESLVKKSGSTVFLDVLPSPDGRHLAYVEKAIDTDVWISLP